MKTKLKEKMKILSLIAWVFGVIAWFLGAHDSAIVSFLAAIYMNMP